MMNMERKKIRLQFADFNPAFDREHNDFIRFLRERYEVELTDHPDYVIYSVFGYQHLDYDCIRIFYTGECVVPDFNECDYALGFDRISFGDRYRRIPFYLLHEYRQGYLDLLKERKLVTREEWRSRKFCNFVVSNCFAEDVRAEFYQKLSRYQKVDSGGRYLNNVGGPVKNKEAFQKNYRFSIAFENTSYKGYLTEKIVDAFRAYTIPIYYGDPDVSLDFNPDAFIDCGRFRNFDEVIQYVKQLEENEDQALRIVNQNPILKPKNPYELRDFLYEIFDRDLSEAGRRPHSINVRQYEAMLKRHRFFEHEIYRPYRKIANTVKRLETGTILRKPGSTDEQNNR